MAVYQLNSSKSVNVRCKVNVAIIVSHPIQHFCPQYVSFAQNPKIHFKVFFASSLGYNKYVDENFKQEISWGNLNLDKFEHKFLNNGAVLPSSSNLDAPELDDELEAFNPSVVIVYGYFQKFQRRAYRWAIKNGKKIGYISDSELRQKRSMLKNLIKSFWMPRYFSKISYFLSVGDANEAYYLKQGVSPSKLLRMHFPIDLAHYQTSYKQKEQLREFIRLKYSISVNDIVISVVGKLVAWKNQDHLIEAVKQLELGGTVVHLLILGSGPMMEEWKQKAAGTTCSKIYMPGFIAPDELPAYYAATDIYVHPASAEPHSLAVSEAVYMGCPVIVSDRCGSYGPNDDVQEGRNGFVYPFGDIGSLKVKIKSLVEDHVKREKFGKSSHQIAMAFQQRSHVDCIQELMARLLQVKSETVVEQ